MKLNDLKPYEQKILDASVPGGVKVTAFCYADVHSTDGYIRYVLLAHVDGKTHFVDCGWLPDACAILSASIKSAWLENWSERKAKVVAA